MSKAPLTPPPGPLNADQLVAHRGWRNRYPENTLLAVNGAIDAGARHIEIDIQFTADAEVVVFHDRNLLRMCEVDLDIYSLSFADLRQFKVTSAQRLGSHDTDTHISSLREVGALVACHPDVTLYIEIKKDILDHFSSEQTLAALAEALPELRPRVVLISFDYAILHHAAALGWRVGPVLCEWHDLDTPTLFPANPDCLFLDREQIPLDARLDALPFNCVVYEIGSRDAALDWLARGAAKVETYYIGEMLMALED
ncbi:MAG TPA: hypothetical protein DIW43_18825 [Spongiibacteraceae bacterium]|nr:hypothetical protein [Spongiibacteraceae bacterium]HCS29516.1 hypothetical protein [Spongiibacteraceae bacterium]|tara:strand:- start:373 stop:1137 length:765 start_codon:yes stop_codon:yes gene_type:complete